MIHLKVSNLKNQSGGLKSKKLKFELTTKIKK